MHIFAEGKIFENLNVGIRGESACVGMHALVLVYCKSVMRGVGRLFTASLFTNTVS